MNPITWTKDDIIRFIGEDDSVGIMQQDAEAARRAMDVMADAVFHGRTLNDVITLSRGEFSTDICDRPALREKLNLVRTLIVEKSNAPISETPTEQQLASVCFSMRHDYGLMGPVARSNLMAEAANWWRAIVRELNEPSSHPMVRFAAKEHAE